MPEQDLSPRLCWKTITVLSVVVALIIFAAVFAHSHLAIDNHPSSQVFIPQVKH